MRWHVFSTSWGWAAFLGKEKTIKATVLPISSSLDIFLSKLEETGYSIRVLPLDGHSIPVVNKFRAYFRGEIISNWDVEIDLSSFSAFSQKVLEYVFTIPYGQFCTYADVARAVGKAGAARAVGRVMGINSIPLIIPCHRVVAHNGLGGFSAPGGIKMKQKMLLMEFSNTFKNLPHFLLPFKE